jgi:hypothetical protein
MTIPTPPGYGTPIASDRIGQEHYPIVKLGTGDAGSAAIVGPSNPLPVEFGAGVTVGIEGAAADYQPGYGLQSEGGGAANVDPGGNLLVRAQSLTDEGTFRCNFANSSLSVALPSNTTLTNGLRTVTWALTATTDLHAGDYIKLDADAESAWAQVESVDSLTAGTLVSAYTGTGGTGPASRALLQQFTGAGGSIAVASGQLTLTSGTTNSARTGIRRYVDYAPLVYRARLSLSARNSNQNFYAGLREDSTTPRWFAWFNFDGTTNTTVKCETGRNPTGAPSASETQSQTITLPNGLTSASVAEVRIELMTETVRFYVNDVLVATNTTVIPQQHDEMVGVAEWLNGTGASTANAVLDYITIKNHNKLEMSVFSNAEQIVAIPQNLIRFPYNVAGIIAINTVLIAIDCANFKSLNIQCTSMGTTGVATPEWSSDPSFAVAVTDTMFTYPGASATTFSAAGAWVTNVKARYYRIRLSTATTAGTTTINVDGCVVRQQTFLATQPVSGTVTANIGTGSLAAGTNAIGDVGIQYRANATGAATITNVACPATPAAQSIKGSAGRLLGFCMTNNNAATRWLKIFNATAVTPGTTSATAELCLPTNQPVNFGLDGGMACGTGITIMITGGQGLTNNTAVTLGDVTGFTAHA